MSNGPSRGARPRLNNSSSFGTTISPTFIPFPPPFLRCLLYSKKEQSNKTNSHNMYTSRFIFHHTGPTFSLFFSSFSFYFFFSPPPNVHNASHLSTHLYSIPLEKLYFLSWQKDTQCTQCSNKNCPFQWKERQKIEQSCFYLVLTPTDIALNFVPTRWSRLAQSSESKPFRQSTKLQKLSLMVQLNKYTHRIRDKVTKKETFMSVEDKLFL